MGRPFDAAGVQWRIFRRWGALGLLIPSRWRRLHRKLCVVDGTVAFCGGINVLDDWYDPNYGTLNAPRFDFAVQVTGPLVQAVHEAMAQFWWRSQAASTVRQSDFPAAWLALQEAVQAECRPVRTLKLPRCGHRPEPVAAPMPTLVLRDNLRNRSRIERAYRKAIGEARTKSSLPMPILCRAANCARA